MSIFTQIGNIVSGVAPEFAKETANKLVTKLGKQISSKLNGDYVKAIPGLLVQQALNAVKGDSKVTEDGDVGNKTKARIKAYQKDKGLKTDGFAGPKTLRKLVTQLGDRAPSGLSELQKVMQSTRQFAKKVGQGNGSRQRNSR